MPAIWRNPSSHWRRGPRRSNRCRAACSGSGQPNGSARASERSTTGSRRIARAVWPRCGPKTGTPAKPTSQRCDGIGTPATPRPCAVGSSWAYRNFCGALGLVLGVSRCRWDIACRCGIRSSRRRSRMRARRRLPVRATSLSRPPADRRK